ncbi:MAG: hypothetical protein ORN83_14990, partial [Chthoniobacteraceae bacterium]|nr:hypothetical protein [Chthoniobacteraceae bacterium]
YSCGASKPHCKPVSPRLLPPHVHPKPPAYYMEARHTWAFPPEKLRLLLAGLLELLPWLHQWHSAVDPNYGASPAESIEALLDAECHDLGLTRVDLNTTRMTEAENVPRATKPRAATKAKASKAAKFTEEEESTV